MDTPLSPDERHQLLEEQLQTVADLVQKSRDASEKSLRFDGSATHLDLQLPEILALEKYLSSKDESPDSSGLGRLIADTTALRFKMIEDIRDLEMVKGVDPELVKKVVGTLDLDINMGEGISAEYGHMIQQTLKDGDRDLSLRLGELRLSVRQDIASARRAIAGDALDVDRGLEPRIDEGFVENAREDPPEAMPGDAHAASQKRVEGLKVKRRKEEEWRRQQKRLKILLGTLGLAVAFGIGQLILYMVPALQGPEIIIVTVADFSKVPAVAIVDARPPSLFVKVHDHVWYTLDKQGQGAALHRIAVILRQANYNGAKLRDENGNLVAEWIRGVGEYVYEVVPPQPDPEPEPGSEGGV